MKRRRGTRSWTPPELLPSAVNKSGGVLVNPAGLPGLPRGTGGFSAIYKPTGEQLLMVPEGRTAHDRVIRLHEALHLNVTPRRKQTCVSEAAHQAVEDIRIHTKEWPVTVTLSIRRDTCAVALCDVHTLLHADPERVRSSREMFGKAMTIYSRSMAILRQEAKHRDCVIPSQVAEWVKKAEKAFGMPMHDLLQQNVVRRAMLGLFNKAEKEFEKLLPPDTPPPPRSSGDYDPATDTASGEGKEGASLDSMSSRMSLKVLEPLSVSTANRRPTRIRTNVGMRINAKRLASAFISKSTSRLFLRKHHDAGGTVLVDASGSMHMDEDTLSSVVRNAPAAKVAYYYGHGDGPSSNGLLFVYAQGGKRFAGTPPRSGGGNSVDYWAVKWLLAQPGPRVIVTDGGFCGGPDAQAGEAMTLLVAAVHRGDITWVSTVEEAQKMFDEGRLQA